ncbi:MAG: sulfatase [Acidobacteria bacterium]|nr:sulfatase [Acidobacteriota bacterium]
MNTGNLSRRQALGALAGSALARGAATPERPNILFIYTDDHSYRTISAWPEAYPWVRTPNIDKLAKQGVRFAATYNAAWCMPSRAVMLTGHHQFAVESMRMEGPYPGCVYEADKCPFWPKVFREKGYFTAQIGKWHTGTDTGYGRDWDFQLVWNRPKFTETSTHYYYDQPITYHGGKTEILKRYSTDQYTDWALDLIRGNGRPKEKPWYLWLCYGAVHGPYQPAERHKQELPGIDFDTPKDVFPPRPGKPDWAQKIAQWEKGPDGTPMSQGRTLTSWVRQYHQGVYAIDEGVGRLMAALEETGQRRNTLVIFTSDQGLAFGQHGFKGVKIAGYDANVRSPLIFSMPGTVPEGKTCDVPVSGVDIPPTIFRFAGLDLPWEMHGHDLTPLLKNPAAPWPHTMMMVATGQTFGSNTNNIPTGEKAMHGGVPWYVMIRDRHLKYIRPLIHDYEELYDLKTDPDELNNLAVKPEHQATLRRLRQKAIAELRRTKAGFVDRMPGVKEAHPAKA